MGITINVNEMETTAEIRITVSHHCVALALRDLERGVAKAFDDVREELAHVAPKDAIWCEVRTCEEWFPPEGPTPDGWEIGDDDGEHFCPEHAGPAELDQ